MTGQHDLEALERLAAGEAAGAEADAAEAHVAGCDECKEELAQLRAERRMFADRAARQEALPPGLWRRVEARVAPVTVSTRRSGRGGWAAVGLVLAAAAGIVAVVSTSREQPGTGSPLAALDAVGPGPRSRQTAPAEPAPADAAVASLDRAEHEYQAALDAIEADFMAKRDKLPPALAARYDEMFRSARQRLAAVRAAAGDDVYARVEVIDAYATHVRKLMIAVRDLQEVSP